MSKNILAIRVWISLAVIAVLLTGTTAFAQGATVVRVDPASQSVLVNDNFNLPILVDNIANLTAVELHLTFDPSVLEVVSVTNGGFVAADFTAQNVFDNGSGTIDYAIAQMNRPPAQGSGVLLNITFHAKSAGTSMVTLHGTQAAPTGLLLSDQNGTEIQASWAGGSVTVGSGSTPTPTPTITPGTPVTTTIQPTASVRIDPSTITVNSNDVFNLLVRIDNAANLSAFEVHLSFDANLLEVKELINGGFVAADVIAQNTFNNTAGTIDYAIAQNKHPASQGSGTLLTIAFHAKSVSGSSRVDLRGMQSAPKGLILSDANGMALPANWISGNVTINVIVEPSVRIHTVQWGEWLYCIGRAYRVSPWAIADTNGIAWWPYIIYPGQQLKIPNVSWIDMPASGPTCKPQFASSPQVVVPVVTSTPIPVVTAIVTATPPTVITPTATPIPSSTCRAIYVVVPGDTLYRIGLSYGVNYAEIARVNQLPNARLIHSGQQLCIP